MTSCVVRLIHASIQSVLAGFDANVYDAMEGALRRQLQPNHGVAKDAHYRDGK